MVGDKNTNWEKIGVYLNPVGLLSRPKLLALVAARSNSFGSTSPTNTGKTYHETVTNPGTYNPKLQQSKILNSKSLYLIEN